MKHQPIFINERKEYFYVCDELFCDKCNKSLSGVFAHCSLFGNKWGYKFNYCLNCYKDSKQVGVVECHIPCMLVKQIPPYCKPVVYDKVGLVEGKYKDCFEAAFGKDEGCEIIDKTKYAGQSWVGSQIGCPDMEALENKDKPIKDEEQVKRLIK